MKIMNKYIKLINEKYPDSKYKTWYINICERSLKRKLTCYVEKHHILPKSLCDDDFQIKDKENIAILTAREHYIVHLLLWKFVGGYSMTTAFMCMNMNSKFHDREVKNNSRLFEKLRYELSIYKSEQLRVNGHPRQGITLTDETKKKISDSLKGKPLSEETKKKISAAAPKRIKEHGAPNTGKKWSDEYKAKMSESCKKTVKTDEWNKKNSEANKGRVHIANTKTKERRRPLKEEADKLISESNGEWIKLHTTKPIPDYC